MTEPQVIAQVDFYEEDYENYYVFADEVEYFIEQEFGSFPVQLVAKNSNWRGQTGYAEADNIEDLMSKISSFGSDEISFKHDETDGCYFRLATHDRPMGFNIYVEPIKQ